MINQEFEGHMSDEADTLPTIQTVLERINALAEDLRSEMRAGFARIEHQQEQMDIRLDRLEGQFDKTHSEIMYLRADFKEFKSQFNQPA
jgi:chromosome segregation ATPase